LVISSQNREDEGTPTSQNTLRNTTRFTPSQNPPQTTPPPENPPHTQSLEHHSPPCFTVSMSPHTTPFKIHNLHNLLSIILYYINLLILPLLLKIHQLNKLFYIVLHHVLLFQSLFCTLPLLFKIHHLHNLLSIILYYISLLLKLPLLLKIHQLNKLFNIVLHHVLLLQCLLRTIPLLFKNVPPTHPLEHHSLQHQSPTHTTTTRPQRVCLVWHQRGMGRVIPYIRDELIHPTKHQMG
jgi:hypothetical protein